jgi:hypothetical protein
MSNVCHGQGNLETSGCCWVEGVRCPLRWKQENGRILDRDRNDLGDPATAVATKIGGPKPKRDRITAAIGQRVYICSAAAKYEGNWDAVHADPDYQALVRPAWERVEQTNGLAPNSYNCGTWGPGTGQCCYGESPEVNAAKAVWMSTVPVHIDIGKKAQE